MSARDRHRLTREIFLAACEVAPAERAAFLDQACGADPSLRLQVDELLATERDRPRFLEDSVPHPDDDGVRAALSDLVARAEPDEVLPETVGGYRVVRLIAHGGMGVVYEARQEHPQRRVAIKVARTAGATTELARRFELEAQLLARLEHPGIAQIIEAGTTSPEAGAQPFFAMEFVEGRSLTDYAKEQRLTARQKLELMVHVCEAVGFAHERGVVHRDLKPDNVLIDASGKPKVLDFGVAKVEAAGGFGAATLRTEAGRVIGTLGYMAPEQLGGTTEGLGPEADVYSLGVMIYQLLTGRLPHELTAATITRALAVVTTTDAPLIGIVRPEYRGDIEAVVAKALEKDHRHRYPDAGALRADLERHLRDEPTLARPAGPLLRLTKWTRRNAALAAAVFGLLLALSVASAILLVKNREVRAALIDNQRLLDASSVELAAAKADKLWPTAEMERALEDWLQDHQELVGRIPVHRAARDRLRARAGTLTGETWTFVDPALQEEHDEIDALVRHLEAFGRSPLFARVEKRLEMARTIKEQTVVARKAEWERAIARIRTNYNGLALKPQVGLVPLGRNEETGLEEFLHFETHDGEIPRLDDRGFSPPVRGDTGLVFVLIPVVPGEKVWIGAQNEDVKAAYYDSRATPYERKRQRRLPDAFFVSKYEMTQGQWERVGGEKPSRELSPNKPVTRVSSEECHRTMQRLGMVLPNELQWEYAARGDTEDPWWTGPDEASLQGAENLFDQADAENNSGWAPRQKVTPVSWRDAHQGSAPVGSYRANGFGLFDVGGNVAEWCSNGPWQVAEGGLPWKRRPATGRRKYRIIRGGSYRRGAKEARSAARIDSVSMVWSAELGLRPARLIEQ